MEFSGHQAARVQALLLRAGVGFCRCAQAVPSSCSSARSTDHPSHIIRYMRLARPCTHMDARSEFDVGHIAGLPTHVSAAADRTARNVLTIEANWDPFAAPQPAGGTQANQAADTGTLGYRRRRVQQGDVCD